MRFREIREVRVRTKFLRANNNSNFITPFRSTNWHKIAPTAFAILFPRNIPQTRTFLYRNRGLKPVNISSHLAPQKKNVLFYGICGLFRNSVFLALKFAFLPPKCAQKFTTSEVVKTTSDLVLTTSKVILTTFEVVFAIFGP